MKLLNHPAVTALGLAYLCLIGLTAPLISPIHGLIYHLSGSAAAIFIPVILQFLLCWLLLTGLFIISAQHQRMRTVLWSSILFFGPWILFKNYQKVMETELPHRFNLLIFAVSLSGFVIFQWNWRPTFLWFDRFQAFLASVLGFASVTGLVVLGQLLWFNWQARFLNDPLPLHQRHSARMIARPRIIWILMDELSYQQIYEHRFPGLKLSAFDELASDASIFTHLVPAGYFTESVIPSIMTGSPVDHIRSSADGHELILHDPLTNTSHNFNPDQTIFRDAILAGYSTAAAGWYNPYCRILHEVLDRCEWSSHLLLSGGIGAQQSIAVNLFAPVARLARTAPRFFFHRSGLTPGDILEIQSRIIDFEELVASADHLLADPSADFLYFHMPIPHPPGIYDRHRGVFSKGKSSYIDNLALADQFIGHVRQTLEERGQWDPSAIVIMGDHSWRTQMWASSDFWTPEDQAASHGGQFDDRPAYIVKMPYQKTPTRIDTRFSAVRTRALLGGIIEGRLKTAEDLAAWVAKNGDAQP